MVSSSKSQRSEAKYDEKLTRKAKKSSLYLGSVQSEARLAAQHAAQRATDKITSRDAFRDDESVGSESSVKSTELAVRRGSRRALVDSFEDNRSTRTAPSVSHDTVSFGLTTIDETSTAHTDTSKKKKKWRGQKYRRKKHHNRKNRQRIVSFGSADDSTSLKMATTTDAWMCGCCGKVFATYKSAEVHEEKCVRDNAARVGLMKAAPPSKNENTNGAQARGTSPPPNRASSSDMFSDAVSCESWEKESVEGETEDQKKNVVGFATAVQQGSPSHTPDQRISGSAPAQSILRHAEPPATSRSLMISPTSQNGTPTATNGPRRPSLRQSSVIPEFRGLDEDLLLPSAMRKYVVLSDEALVNVVLNAIPATLSPSEIDAERELKLLAGDKAYYDAMSERAEARKKYRLTRSDGTGVLAKVQNKFVDAYQLIKEGDGDTAGVDQYASKKKGADSEGKDISHTDGTIYINVIVKNSVRVVDNELARMGQQRWEDLRESTIVKNDTSDQFERFRKFAHAQAIKIAGLALQSDFTPRRIAVQLSNDLYRLMVPRLKKRGVAIETEIEYRVGAYFVLAANIKSIDWVKMMQYSKKDKDIRRRNWEAQQSRRNKLREGTGDEADSTDDEPSRMSRVVQSYHRVRSITAFEVIATCLAWLDYLPRIVSVPFCWITYHFFLKSTMKIFILSTAADRIFAYVEEKGMEMDISVKQSRYQAPFMLSALRELREDSRELKKKQKETESDQKGVVLGPLLGPAIKSDKGPATPPPGFEVPENLETVGLEMDLPVGFKRLRWAMLNSESHFMQDAVFKEGSKYEDITIGEWSVHDKEIGLATLPTDVKPEDCVGAEKEVSYLMPKSAFVSANMAYETHILTEYSDYCFVLKKKTRTPDVPYGSTFICWTQVVVTNTGNDSCRMVCSVEAEFPNGPPMVSGSIKSGMRSGTAQFFVLLGQTICNYADEYP